MTKLSIFLFCAGCGVMSAKAQVQSHRDISNIYDMSLEQLGKVEVITATGNSTPLDQTPSTVSVVTTSQIESMGVQSLDEVLELIPGIHVSLSTISRLESVYSIRGIHNGFSPHALLLLNGVPVQFSLQGGRPVMFRLPVSNIARIEVIRGPGSAIYGADAYSGVINVISKDASTINNNEVGARLGSFGGREAWTTAKADLGEWDITFNMNYQSSDGDDKRVIEADLQSILDGVFATGASLASGPLSTRYELLNTNLGVYSEHVTVNVWSWNSQDSGVGHGGAQALDYHGHDDNELYLVDAMWQTGDIYENWNHALRLSHQHYDTQAEFDLLPPGTVVPIGADGNLNFAAPAGIVQFPDGLLGNPGGLTQDTIFEFVSMYAGFDEHRWRVALGSRRQSFDSRETKNFGPGVIDGSQPVVDGTLTDVSDTPFVFIQDVSRRTNYISVQDEWQFAADWRLTAGVRFDDYSDFGSTTNPRLALVWDAHENVTAKLLYGSAFRAPSFSQQFNENNPVVLGNPELEPETIDTYELSLSLYLRDNLTSSVNFFRYEAEDLIEFVPDPGETTSTAQNIRNQNGQGVEVEVNWDVGNRFRLSGNYSYQDSEDADTAETIADAPGQQISVIAHWQFVPSWSLNTIANWVADRERVTTDPRPPIDDYTLVDINLRKAFTSVGLDVAFMVKNALDEDAREPSDSVIPNDFPLPSRSVWLEARYQF